MIHIPVKSWHVLVVNNDGAMVFREGLDFEKHSIGFTLVEDGRIYAVFGGVYIWDGVYETYLFPSTRFKSRALGCIRVMIKVINSMIDKLKIHRLQTIIPVLNSRDKRWIEWMGFKAEGIMYKFGPDKIDYYRYARVM